MTFFYLTNFLYVKTVLTIWSVSQFAIFKNRHIFADPITYYNAGKLHHRKLYSEYFDFNMLFQSLHTVLDVLTLT